MEELLLMKHVAAQKGLLAEDRRASQWNHGGFPAGPLFFLLLSLPPLLLLVLLGLLALRPGPLALLPGLLLLRPGPLLFLLRLLLLFLRLLLLLGALLLPLWRRRVLPARPLREPRGLCSLNAHCERRSGRLLGTALLHGRRFQALLRPVLRRGALQALRGSLRLCRRPLRGQRLGRVPSLLDLRLPLRGLRRRVRTRVRMLPLLRPRLCGGCRQLLAHGWRLRWRSRCGLAQLRGRPGRGGRGLCGRCRAPAPAPDLASRRGGFSRSLRHKGLCHRFGQIVSGTHLLAPAPAVARDPSLVLMLQRRVLLLGRLPPPAPRPRPGLLASRTRQGGRRGRNAILRQQPCRRHRRPDDSLAGPQRGARRCRRAQLPRPREAGSVARLERGARRGGAGSQPVVPAAGGPAAAPAPAQAPGEAGL
mmetsp:Transcript_7063/g.22337  ORF Transcript_7063/g.22337 Transcript_7063/m.22337 type:complete len:420 (+) Transcript_7063:522-1781(+)